MEDATEPTADDNGDPEGVLTVYYWFDEDPVEDGTAWSWEDKWEGPTEET